MGLQFLLAFSGLLLLSLQLVAGIPLQGSSHAGVAEDRIAKYLLPCNIQKGQSGHVPTSVHALNPLDIKVFSTLRSFKLTSDVIRRDSLWSSSFESALHGTSLAIQSYVAKKLSPSVSQISLPPGKQLIEDEAKALVESLKETPGVSFADDWKMVMVFVTAPDPCGFCYQRELTEEATSTLTRVLDYLHQHLPKTLVNVVDLTGLTGHYMSNPNRPIIRKSCDCFQKVSDYTSAMFRFTFQDALERIVSAGRYETREDFTVALHPVLHMLKSWTPDMSIQEYEESYDLPCSEKENSYLNTHRNSPYEWLSSKLNPVESRSTQTRNAIGSEFTCTDLSPSDTVPTSVHELRPADFKVVAALGDSITAGNGAGAIAIDLLDVVTEYRGISWSIGGDEELENVTSIANMLRKFNPSLEGFSTGRGFHFLPRSNLNRAVPGAKADDMHEQAVSFVERLRALANVSFEDDWKLLTIFIGGNDLCGICRNPTYHSPERFVQRLEETFDYLIATVPRLFVNLVTVMDILPLKILYDDTRTNCPEQIMSALCSCVVDNKEGSLEISILKEFNKQYQVLGHKLVESGKYDTKDDFTIVIQPMLEELEIPINEAGIPDRSFMAPDCFHFGKKAHAQAARGLWTNMFQPVGNKTTGQRLDVDIPIVCPTASDPYVKTAKNSGYVYPTPAPPDPDHGNRVTCTEKAPSPTRPSSVHALRPADVTVVAAIGDSLTAGNGIGSAPNDILDVFTVYRGLSWSIGGDSDLTQVTTLPNILLEFNHHLTGYATGLGSSSDHNSFLNQAVPGAKAADMPTQARALVNQMIEDRRVNMNSDWKVITVLIGANDLCSSCEDSNIFSPTAFISNIQEALDILHSEVPSAFVNLVEVMDIYPLREATMNPRANCPGLVTMMLCPCLMNILANSTEMQNLRNINQAYQYNIRQLIDSGRYDTREDFTVVLQPFFGKPIIPYLEDGAPDVSYLAPDCFHLSQKAHTQLAKMLWRNMLEPVGHKTDHLDFIEEVALSCPTVAQPFLRTFRNSDYVYPAPPPTEPPNQNFGSDMTCAVTAPSNQIPTSVHKLRPADIKVLAALGDSLTAGFGLRSTTLLDLAREWRGVSWSIGGDATLDTITTLPNIFKKFNADIKGYSTGMGTTSSWFNVAVGGAKAENMPAQARRLADAMKASTEINFDEDWKVVTLFIGGNDLCQYCSNRERHSAENHVGHIENALVILYDEIPRVFVNLVLVMEVQGLRRVKAETIGCGLLKPTFCPCFINPREDSPEYSEIKRYNKDLQEQVAALAQKFQGREDFAVVPQPFFQNTVVPVNLKGEPDVRFFAVDCFHFSERGHSEMAIALWNNMLEPVGQKQNFNSFIRDRSKLKCPQNENHYLYTLKNSGLPENETPTGSSSTSRTTLSTASSSTSTTTSTTTTTRAPNTAVPIDEKEDQVPYWAVIIASIGGVALGCAVVGTAMHISAKKRKEKTSTF